MKEDARKLLELHEQMKIHEWRKISKSFEVCQCGMCRGSNNAYNSKARRVNRYSRIRQNIYPTDWMTLSELRSKEKWISSKMVFADRIKDYLIQFPFWAGYYAKNGEAELMDVHLQDDQFLLEHSVKNKIFNPEIEARLRSNETRLLAYLENKAQHEGTKGEMEIDEESRESLMINGGSYFSYQLAKLEGPGDDTRQACCEQDEGTQMVDYSRYIDNAPSDMVKEFLIKYANEGNSNAVGYIYHYCDSFKLFRDEELKKALFLTPRGTSRWIQGIRLKDKIKEEDRKEVSERMIAFPEFKGAEELRELTRANIIPLTPEVANIVMTCSYGGEKHNAPKLFDRKLWNVLISRPSGWAKGFLTNWKRELRNRWTEDIERLEKEVKDAKTNARMVEARLKSRECVELKAWAHSLLQDYKKVMAVK